MATRRLWRALPHRAAGSPWPFVSCPLTSVAGCVGVRRLLIGGGGATAALDVCLIFSRPLVGGRKTQGALFRAGCAPALDVLYAQLTQSTQAEEFAVSPSVRGARVCGVSERPDTGRWAGRLPAPRLSYVGCHCCVPCLSLGSGSVAIEGALNGTVRWALMASMALVTVVTVVTTAANSRTRCA